jgi:hypothetical protein
MGLNLGIRDNSECGGECIDLSDMNFSKEQELQGSICLAGEIHLLICSLFNDAVSSFSLYSVE